MSDDEIRENWEAWTEGHPQQRSDLFMFEAFKAGAQVGYHCGFREGRAS